VNSGFWRLGCGRADFMEKVSKPKVLIVFDPKSAVYKADDKVMEPRKLFALFCAATVFALIWKNLEAHCFRYFAIAF
jgi:hypothetical protein